jgi:hypothetical protein
MQLTRRQREQHRDATRAEIEAAEQAILDEWRAGRLTRDRVEQLGREYEEAHRRVLDAVREHRLAGGFGEGEDAEDRDEEFRFGEEFMDLRRADWVADRRWSMALNLTSGED